MMILISCSRGVIVVDREVFSIFTEGFVIFSRTSLDFFFNYCKNSLGAGGGSGLSLPPSFPPDWHYCHLIDFIYF